MYLNELDPYFPGYFNAFLSFSVSSFFGVPLFSSCSFDFTFVSF